MGCFKNKLNDLQSFFFFEMLGSLLLLPFLKKKNLFSVSGPQLRQLWPFPCRPHQGGGGVLRLGSGVLRRFANRRPRAQSCWLDFFFLFVFGKTEAWKLSSEIVAYYLHQSSGTAARERESEKYSWKLLCCHGEKKKTTCWQPKKKTKERKREKKSEEMLGDVSTSAEGLLTSHYHTLLIKKINVPRCTWFVALRVCYQEHFMN